MHEKGKGEAQYAVLRKSTGGSYQKIATVSGTSYLDTTTEWGVTYTYTIRCVSANGKSYTSGYRSAGSAGTWW